MPLKINESTTYLDRAATLTVTITLVSRARIDEMSKNFPLPEGARMQPINEAIASGQTHTTIPLDLVSPPRSIAVSYQDIIAANPDIDPADAFVHYEAQLQMDYSQSAPLYPSDMVDELRKSGVSEEELQRLLADEKWLRNNQ